MDLKALGQAGALIFAAAVIAVPIGYFLLPPPEPELPALYPMPDFALTDEQGRATGADTFRGRVLVANFIFTSCPTVCPVLTRHMAGLQDRLADLPDAHLLSFSVDPKNDTPEVLAAYARDFGQAPGRWTFLTGELGAVEEAVIEGFKVHMDGYDDPEATAFDIVHGEHFVLVDRQGMIRGYYQPTGDGLERLEADARRLHQEIAP